jgi:hypothetical protein
MLRTPLLMCCKYGELKKGRRATCEQSTPLVWCTRTQY